MQPHTHLLPAGMQHSAKATARKSFFLLIPGLLKAISALQNTRTSFFTVPGSWLSWELGLKAFETPLTLWLPLKPFPSSAVLPQVGLFCQARVRAPELPWGFWREREKSCKRLRLSVAVCPSAFAMT